ncbi:cytochrome P450 [Streptomyces palmae]|uniref:Cytochrome P450 n=1 Tax=Streptomyces palmae TaxID=1701085 RepID=A0A4Z0H941_9ACTN|nr:cytochrome P450 [Streptomyces palmae]TGB13668.1 cytochrome P450 [Streptomyces palmae]
MRARRLVLPAALLGSLPYWLPRSVVALRGTVFARVNGQDTLTFPSPSFGPERFTEVYGHPGAVGRSKGAALSDLFWYWLAPGPQVHQEHLEPGARYAEVAATTRAVLAGSGQALSEAAARCTASVLDAQVTRRASLVRLRDLMMPVWAEFFYELVFREPCPPQARRLIVDNADDVVSALKCTRPRHLGRRDRLTRYLLRRLAAGQVPHELPRSLTEQERAWYLQGTFFNTAVVQMSEAMAHLLLVLARHPGVQRRLAERPADDAYLSQVMNETFRLYPLFGVAHRVATTEIALPGAPVIPQGSVLCFSYPDYHACGWSDPEVFRPSRWTDPAVAREAHHIPFGVAGNRPCPAWRLAPLVMRAATREVLRRFTLDSPVSHTRSLPHRGPCLLVRRTAPLPSGQRHAVRAFLRTRDRWEDVWRAPLQLVLGTGMVLAARRQRPAERYFATHDTEGRPLPEGDGPRCPFGG